MHWGPVNSCELETLESKRDNPFRKEMYLFPDAVHPHEHQLCHQEQYHARTYIETAKPIIYLFYSYLRMMITI